MFGSEKILARRFDTGLPVRVNLRKGSIVEIENADSAPDDMWIAPSLFDPQINGFAGVDFQSGNISEQEFLRAVDALKESACGQIFLTLTTASWPILIQRLKDFRALCLKNKALRAAVSGWHIEGPFMSAEPGFHGAHDPALMLDPTPERIRELREAAGDDPLMFTLSPERPGAIEAIALATSLKIRISLGHTNAPVDSIAQAVKAGATGFTHLGNGCTQTLDRHDNIVLRVCDNPGLCVSLIPDGIHVSPQLFRLLHAALPRERICYTTDAMSAAGAPPGRYRLGKVELDVGADKIVRQPGRSNFAGSALRPIDGVFKAAEMLGCSWREVWSFSALASRKYAGISTRPESMPFCILKVGGNEFQSGKLYADGASHEITRS